MLNKPTLFILQKEAEIYSVTQKKHTIAQDEVFTVPYYSLREFPVAITKQTIRY